MTAGTSGVVIPLPSTVYWEVVNGTSTNTIFNTRSGTATIDPVTKKGTFTVPTKNDNTYVGDKTFSVDIYKDSTKAVLLASSVKVTVKDTTPMPTAAPTAAPTAPPTEAPTQPPTAAPTEAPVDPITNFVAKANSVGYELSFNTTLVGTTLYVTADRRSTGGTDNDYVGMGTPTESFAGLSGSTVKYSVGQVLSIKTGSYDGVVIAQTTAIAMAEPAPVLPVVTNVYGSAWARYDSDNIVYMYDAVVNTAGFTTNTPGITYYITTDLTGWSPSSQEGTPISGMNSSSWDHGYTFPIANNRIAMAEYKPSSTVAVIPSRYFGATIATGQGLVEQRQGSNGPANNVVVGRTLEVRINGYDGPIVGTGTWTEYVPPAPVYTDAP